jgi:hypothetical protein
VEPLAPLDHHVTALSFAGEDPAASKVGPKDGRSDHVGLELRSFGPRINGERDKGSGDRDSSHYLSRGAVDQFGKRRDMVAHSRLGRIVQNSAP